MKMKDKRYSLVVIIILLIIFLPLTILGYVYKINHKVEENPNHELYYQGKIWFYDASNTYVSKYECLTEVCGFAKSSVDEEEKDINYYKDGIKDTLENISDSYALIQDGNVIKLYDIKRGESIQDYLKVKNYSTNLTDNVYIIENTNNMWGVLYIKDIVNVVIPFEYDFIGLKNELDSNKNLIANKYIVKKDSWYLISKDNKEISSKFDDKIVDYNDNYIITYNNTYKIYNYDKKEYFNNIIIEKYLLENEYIGIISNNTLYIYINLNSEPLKTINITSGDKVLLKYENNRLNIYEDNKLIDSVA